MTDIITSTGNPRVKEALRLRGRRGRAEGEHILIDGIREIGRAADAGAPIEEAFYCDELLEGDDARSLLHRIKSIGARLTHVNQHVFEKLRYGDRTGGIVVVARRPHCKLDDLAFSPNALIAVIEDLQKPGNLGAILRTADAAGIEAVIAVDPDADIYGPNVIRASIGTVFCVPLVEAAASDAVAWLRSRGFRIIAASPDADRIYTEIDFTGRLAMVFGSEAQGLSRHWQQADVVQARVPMLGKADSLNVATTASLFFYEARRQRGVIE